MKPDRLSDREVLVVVSVGLILILGGIIVGIFTSPRSLPNWAENVLVSIGTASVLKLGDCLSTLVALSSGKSVERLGNQLAGTTPVTTPPSDSATTAASSVADAAVERADEIAGK